LALAFAGSWAAGKVKDMVSGPATPSPAGTPTVAAPSLNQSPSVSLQKPGPNEVKEGEQPHHGLSGVQVNSAKNQLNKKGLGERPGSSLGAGA
jgi:hypothetical protein